MASALATAPFMPAAGSVSTSVAPNALNRTRRSMDMDAGIVSTSLYPLRAATAASAMPVLPLVGSTSVVRPGAMMPAASAPSIMDRPMLGWARGSSFFVFLFFFAPVARSPSPRLSRRTGP